MHMLSLHFEGFGGRVRIGYPSKDSTSNRNISILKTFSDSSQAEKGYVQKNWLKIPKKRKSMFIIG